MRRRILLSDNEGVGEDMLRPIRIQGELGFLLYSVAYVVDSTG
jgi:hypothetical protein